MIRQINSNKLSVNTPPQQNEPSFKGAEGIGTALFNGATWAVQQCEMNPMLNVAVLDVATAIAPRTIVEGQTNPYAGLEALRRESSGLVINCMIPGVIVAGLALPLQRLIMGEGSDMSKCWANEETIHVITKHWAEAPDVAGKLFDGDAHGVLKKKTYNTLHSILAQTRGVDGENVVDFKVKELEGHIKTIADNIVDANGKYTKVNKKAISKASSAIIEKTHISENIYIGKTAKGLHSQSLGDVIKNSPHIFMELSKGALNGKSASEFAKEFAAKATKLVTSKSLLGLGVILPLALAAQPVNRWITEKTSGKKGAPIYKDFEHTKSKELSGKEKAALFRQKLVSVGAMIGVAMLSIGKLPNKAMFKSVSQFKGMFPSMDQARIIATATFASRMMSSEDKNDLREATVRDIATFSAFYFLGDYVAKGFASWLQTTKKCKEKGIVLINDLKKLPKDANILEKALHWTKDTAMKSSEELLTKEAKNYRAASQLVNIGFSLLALGLFIPLYNRHQTNKKHEAELKAKAEMQAEKTTQA